MAICSLLTAAYMLPLLLTGEAAILTVRQPICPRSCYFNNCVESCRSSCKAGSMPHKLIFELLFYLPGVKELPKKLLLRLLFYPSNISDRLAGQ
jgi:hypothetical protein